MGIAGNDNFIPTLFLHKSKLSNYIEHMYSSK